MLGQGRLRAARTVRLLHRPRRRRAPRRVRHADQPAGRPFGDDTGRVGPPDPRSFRGRVRRDRRIAMRILHARHRRTVGRRTWTRPRSHAGRAPVPLHRVVHGVRRHPRRRRQPCRLGDDGARSRCGRSPRPTRRRRRGRPLAPTSRSAAHPSPTTPRRRRARRGAAPARFVSRGRRRGRDALGRGGLARRRPTRRRQSPGPAHDGRGTTTVVRRPRRMSAERGPARDVMGRTRISGTGRVVVRAGR